MALFQSQLSALAVDSGSGVNVSTLKRHVLGWSGAFVLAAGVLGAVLLPPGRGKCGFPPYGLNEFCRGDDYRLNGALLLGSWAVAAMVFGLAIGTRVALGIGSALMLLLVWAAALLIPAGLTCPPGQLVHYGLTVDHSPVCAPPGSRADGTSPVVNDPVLFRILIAGGGSVVGLSLLSVAALRPAFLLKTPD
jgi:hypothetical protein